jgi:hypothetical protein
MKLKQATLQLDAALAEFDIWITPSLGEIRDTARFKEEMDRVVGIFDALAKATQDFDTISLCDPAAIADYFTTLTRTMEPEKAYTELSALASVLFLVTAKSDNNAKCQLPLFLRDSAKWKTFPRAVTRKGKAAI